MLIPTTDNVPSRGCFMRVLTSLLISPMVASGLARLRARRPGTRLALRTDAGDAPEAVMSQPEHRAYTLVLEVLVPVLSARTFSAPSSSWAGI
jgi:hypothetical protein